MTRKKLAFVLGGGGAHGASQVGALKALLEADIHPDMLVGTSIGAVNCAFLALKGVNLEGIKLLTQAWKEAKEVAATIMPPNYLWLSLLAMLGRQGVTPIQGFKEFLLLKVGSPDVRFKDIYGVELYLVASDLYTGRPVFFGADPEDSLIDGIEASVALPPWRQPIKSNGYYLVDGGFVSNLPIEPALARGATQIIALDLTDPLGTQYSGDGTKVFLSNTIQAVVLRQRELEMALAEARGVPTLDIVLSGFAHVAIWDFNHIEDMMATGYRITQERLHDWENRLLLNKVLGRRRLWNIIRDMIRK